MRSGLGDAVRACDPRADSCRARRFACGAAIAAYVLASASAFGDSTCVVRAHGTHSDEWSRAIDRVARTIDDIGGRAGDCRDIDVLVDRDGAIVTFTTSDGRTAVRRIKQPSELLPLVDALVIAEPEPAAAHIAPAPPPFTLSIAERPAAPSRETADVNASRTIARRGHVLISAGAGLRLTPGFEASGVAQLAVGALFDRWELGLMGRWEPDQEQDDDPSVGHLHLSALGGGAIVGHRIPVGQLVLVFGATFGVYGAEESLVKRSLTSDARIRTTDSFVDPRVGAYAAFVLPPFAGFRLRSQVDAAYGAVAHVPSSAELPVVPRWSLALAVGAETSVLP